MASHASRSSCMSIPSLDLGETGVSDPSRRASRSEALMRSADCNIGLIEFRSSCLERF